MERLQLRDLRKPASASAALILRSDRHSPVFGLTEAAVQLFRAAALFLGYSLPWHIPAPLGVPRRIIRQSWALKAATEALVRIRLDHAWGDEP